MSKLMEISTIIEMGKRGTENEWMSDDDIICQIEEVLEDVKHIISLDWGVEDVRSIDRWKKLTDEQCMEVLRAVDRNHDANIGVNWEVIDTQADNLFGGD